ncbi:hypothetical protein ACKVMT_09960 [Halobacteriales archaeon Cl-PHB]
MSQRIEFGSREAADAAREQFGEYVCPEDDDRREKAVAFVSDAPEQVIEQARLQAAEGQGEWEGGAGQVPLSEAEKDRIDFGQDRANVPHARSVKGIARAEGVDDWLAYYDPSLTVDEHREVMADAATEGGGRRLDADDSAVAKAGEAAKTAQAESCDHARGHCKNGEPEACEFLQQTCGYSETEVEEILGLADDRHQGDTEQTDLVTVGGGRFPEMQVTPEEAGALRRAWRSYKAGVGTVEGLLADLRSEVVRTRQAWATINRLRGEHDQPDLHPDRLHGLLESLAEMPATIPEVRTLDHFAGSGKEQVLSTDDQRTLEGERANDQARLAGGEQGEQGQGEVEQPVEANEGGLMADQRESTGSNQTEQQRPDFMQVAEGGQKTL